MLTPQEYQLLDHLSQYITLHKKECIEKVLSLRTRHISVVMEDIYQSQNASAVIRTCEGMGIQDVHVIENDSVYQINKKVLKGANKWIDLIRYREKNTDNTSVCFDYLKRNRYKILGLDPSEDGTSIHDIEPAEHKIALVFGNELKGLSEYALKNCDIKVHIPMQGFTESYNVSVSAAISLSILLTKLKKESAPTVGLTQAEKDVIRLQWYRKIVRRSDIIVQQFMRTFK